MTKVVNLRVKRKAQARDMKRQQGSENAALFGRTKDQRIREAKDTQRAKAHLDGHQRDQNS